MRLTLADLLPGTQYVVQVRANNGTALSPYSPAFEFTTDEDTTSPKVPTNVTWVVVGDAFYGEWDSMGENVNNDYANIVRYELELIGNAVTKIVSVPQITESRNNYTLSFEENKSLFGTPAASVRLRVRSVDIKDLKSAWSTPITVANGAPNAPASASTNSGSGNIQVSWAASTSDDVVSYNVYNGTTAGFTPSAGNRVFSGNALTFIFTTASTAVQYFKIRAVDKFGQESTDTSTSGTATTPFGVDTTPPDAPTSVTATSAGIDTLSQQQSINVAWTASASTDVGRYEIRYANNTSGPWQVMSVGADQTSARIESLSPGWAYYVAVRAVDFFANESAWVNANNYPLTPTYDTTPPSKPAAPTAAVGTQRLQVTASANKDAGGPMEQDVDYFQVFASTTNGFTPSATNMIGRIYWGPAMVETFQIPAASTTPAATTETWYVVVKAVDKAGNVSVASNQVTAAVGLILTANIGDAQITTAKIQSLEANKITAGTGIINDLTIKSKLTLGDASTVGYIESYDYTTSGGTTGFQFSKNGLIIKTGSIEAAALKIQRGAANLIPGEYSSFELPSTFYSTTAGNGSGGTGTWSISTAQKYHGTQALSVSLDNTTTSGGYSEWLGGGVIPVTPNTQYIISYYVYQVGGAANDTRTYPTIDGNAFGGSSRVPTSSDANDFITSTGTWIRKTWNFTTGANETAVKIYPRVMNPSTTARTGRVYYIDSVMLEQRMSAETTASSYVLNGITQIDGGMIKTGEIRSTSNLVINGQSQPTWYINTGGAAQFGNLWVRGSMVVGAAAEDTGTGVAQAGSSIHSHNYVPNSTGWSILSNGSAEFFNIKARGDIEASSIKANTIISQSIIAQGTGGIHAYGIRGEDVGMTGAGFQVLGAYEISISSVVSTTTNFITFTTDGTHGFTNGNSVIVTGTTTWDGSYTISSIPSSSTFTVPFTTATFGATSIKGLAQSMASGTNSSTRPLLIDFPTDGAKPNIVSGKLAASTLSVSVATSLQGTTTVENGVVSISRGVTNPTIAPTLSPTWDMLTSTYVSTIPSNLYERNGMTIGPDGHYWFTEIQDLDVVAVKINSSTGAMIETRTIATLTDRYARTWNSLGIVYNTASSNFHVAYQIISGTTYSIRIKTYSSTWTFIGDNDFTLHTGVTITQTASSPPGPPTIEVYLHANIGWDFINNKLIMAYYYGGYSAGQRLRYVEFTMTSGRPTAIASNNYMHNGDGVGVSKQVSHVSRMTDIDNTVLDLMHVGFGDGEFKVWSSTSFNEINYGWESPPGTLALWGAAYNTTKKQIFGLLDTGFVEYATGEYVWYDTYQDQNKVVRYTWYDSVASKTGTVTNISGPTATTAQIRLSAGHGFTAGELTAGTYIEVGVTAGSRFNGMVQVVSADLVSSPNTITYTVPSGSTFGLAATSGTVKLTTNETASSPWANIGLPKRAKLKVTIPSIPYSTSGVVPDKARIYLNTITGGGIRVMTQITYPSTSINIPMSADNVNIVIPQPLANTFSLVNFPSKIQTSDAVSYWDGIGNAVFKTIVNLDDTGWQNVTFQNGWVNFDTRTVQYRRIGNRVFLRGIMKSGTVNATAFNLPAGCRPTGRVYSDHHFPVMSNGALGMIGIDGGNGNVILMSGSNVWTDLSAVTFLTD